MKVKDLKAALETLDDEAIVVLQKDSEGNGFSPLDGLDDNCTYVPESPWYGEVYLKELTQRDREQGYEEDDVRSVEDGAQVAVVLYPIN